MKVVHITTYDRGGAGKACIAIHKALLSIGVDSKLLVLNKTDYSVPESYAATKKTIPGFLERIGKKSLRILQEFRLSKQALSFEKKHLANRPEGFDMFSFPFSEDDLNAEEIVKNADLINFHWVAGFIDYSTFFKKNSKKLVWTLHDMNPFTGGCHYSSGCELFLKECAICPQLKGTIDQSVSHKNFITKNRALSTGSDLTIVTPSHWLGTLSSKSTLLKKYKHKVIHNPVDSETFKPFKKDLAREVFGIPPEVPLMLFVADNLINKRKGYELLLEAIENVNHENSVFFGVIGFSDSNFKLNPNIKQLGIINDDRMMGLAYSAADFTVVPSLEDNLPNVVTESLLCGTPVIGFAVGGIREMIQQGNNGYLAKHTDRQSLKDVIQMGLENLGKLDTQRISKEAIGKYNFTKIANEYLELYKE